MGKVKDTIVGTQLDPQYGWVVADPSKSQNFNPIAAAKDLFAKMYGEGALSKELNYLKQIPKERFDRASSRYIGAPPQESTDYKNYNDLMSWYYAASNPQYQNDPAYKSVVDYYSMGLNKHRFNREKFNVTNITKTDPGALKGPFGEYLANWKDPQLGSITKKYGQDAYDKAYAAVLRNSMADPTPLKSVQPGDDMWKRIVARPDPKGLRDYEAELNLQGGLPGATYSYGSGLNTPRQSLYGQDDIRRTYKGAGYLAGMDPNLYGVTELTRYFEGANPNLISTNGLPWMGRDDAKNKSWEAGGEFLTDEAFQYYKNRSQPGIFSSDWSNVGTNSNLMSGTFNNQRSFFTPYDYAIKGIPDEQAKVTNISAADPNFWARQGNLQNLNGTWGFVTQQDPYAGLESSNIALQPDTLTATLRTFKKGGFLSGLIGALPSLGLSLIPGVGPFASIASGIQGIGNVASIFDKDKTQNGLPSWYQPSIYPNYIR